MLKEKLDNLINLGNVLIAEGRNEVGTRLLKFCEDPTKPEFPMWCAANGIDEMFVPLARSGFDFSINYGRTDRKEDRITLQTIAQQNGHEELANKIKKLTIRQIKLSQQLLDRAKEGLLTSTKRRNKARMLSEVKGVKQLINEGAVIDWRGFEKTTALIFACQYGRVDVVKLLIEAGANVNATDFMGATPLMWASYSNNVEIMKILIEAGADVNIRDTHNGSTALIWWATNSDDNVEAVDLLVKNNARIFTSINIEKAIKNKVLDNDRTALDHAKTRSNYKIVKYLEAYRIQTQRNTKIHISKDADECNPTSVSV